jgi:Glycosyl transferases group 1
MHMVHDAPGLRLRHGVVIFCGDVARLFQPMSADPASQHLFRDVRLLGLVPGDDLLAAFYAQADVAIIPRLHGGGSNLKFAEALLSGRPIVVTSRAFTMIHAIISLRAIIWLSPRIHEIDGAEPEHAKCLQGRFLPRQGRPRRTGAMAMHRVS